jgi:dTDP-4-amino-4,6-dideoxygalactose transaminase
MATQSFHETKNVTCGEGGALMLNDKKLIDRAEILREKGTNRSLFLKGQVDKYTWVDVGSSWVISDLLAAVLSGQLERIDEINNRRLQIWNRYQTELKHWSTKHHVSRPYIPDECEHVGHVYHLRFSDGEQRSRFIFHMKEREISCVFHYQPLHISPVGRTLGGFSGQCPVAEQAGECLVRLPLFNSMSDEEQNRVIEAAIAFNP